MTDRRIRIGALLLGLVIALTASPALGQNKLTGKYREGSDATLSVPLRPLARPGDHLLLEFEIRTREPLDGTIRVTMTTGDETPPTVRPIQVGRGSTHKVSVPVRLPSWAAPIHVVIRDRAGWYVRIDAGDLDPVDAEEPTPTVASPIPVRTEVLLSDQAYDDDALHVAVLGDDPLGWTLVRSMNGDAVESHLASYENERAIVSATLLPTEAPSTWYGWSTADVVVWRRPNPEELTPEQVDALLGFMAAGGTLIVSLDATYPSFAQSAFGRVSGLEFGRLGQAPGALAVLAGGLLDEEVEPASLTAVSVSGGDVRLTHGGWVLVTEQAVGAGRMVVLPWDVADEALKGEMDRAGWWRRLLGLELPAAELLEEAEKGAPEADVLTRLAAGSAIAPRHRGPVRPAALGWAAQAHEVLEKAFEGLSPLPVAFLIVFGIFYLAVIGPGDFFLVRRLGRPALTWLTFPAAAVLFSVVAIVAISLGRSGGSEIACVEVVDEVPRAGLARGSTWCSLWSSDRSDVVFSVPDASGWIATPWVDPDLSWSETETWEDVVIRPDGRSVSLGLQTAPWSLSRLRAAWIGEGAEGEVVFDDGVIRNDSTLAFEEAWFVWGERFWPLGPLAPGESASVPDDGGTAWTDQGRARWSGSLHPLAFAAPGQGGLHRDLSRGPGTVAGWTASAHPPSLSGELTLKPQTRTFRRIPVTRREAPKAPEETP